MFPVQLVSSEHDITRDTVGALGSIRMKSVWQLAPLHVLCYRTKFDALLSPLTLVARSGVQIHGRRFLRHPYLLKTITAGHWRWFVDAPIHVFIFLVIAWHGYVWAARRSTHLD